MKTISSKKSTLKFFGARLKQLRLQNGLTAWSCRKTQNFSIGIF